MFLRIWLRWTSLEAIVRSAADPSNPRPSTDVFVNEVNCLNYDYITSQPRPDYLAAGLDETHIPELVRLVENADDFF